MIGRRFLPFSILFAACAAASGCAVTRGYSVGINSFAAPNAAAYRTYILLPSDERISPADLEFQEFASYLHRALVQRGLQPVSEFAQAQLAIFLDYGIGEPREHTIAALVPLWGQTGVSSSKTTGNVSVYGNQAYVNSETRNTPQYGVTGYVPRTDQYTTFSRFVTVRAVDVARFNATQKLEEVWKTRIVSVGSSGDLRLV